MGIMVDGKWELDDLITSGNDGSFKRPDSVFRNSIDSNSKFLPEKDRYHLYVSYACPWAHRTLITRSLKGLEDIISVSVVHPDMLEYGWSFNKSFKEATGDQVNSKNYLHEIYSLADEKVNGRVTVPVLWDKKLKTIVNNESSEIILMLNSSFENYSKDKSDFYPNDKRDEIDELNEKIYHEVNNGVYKCGFAKTQNAYDLAVTNLFNTLDELEDRLESSQYLVGNELTVADIRLFPTLIRFDLVYYSHFKCNLKLISQYKNLSRYIKNMYNNEKIFKTVNFDHIKRHYYYSQKVINPFQIVPIGPENFI